MISKVCLKECDLNIIVFSHTEFSDHRWLFDENKLFSLSFSCLLQDTVVHLVQLNIVCKFFQVLKLNCMWTVASNTEFFLPLKVLIPINFNTNLIPSWLKILQFKISISLSHSFVPINKFIIFTFLLDHKESNIRILIAGVALEHGLANLGD